MEIEVECYAGYRSEETPRKIRIGKNQIAVVEVLDRWLSPEYRYFKLIGNDRAIYIIRNDTDQQFWELVLFKHPQAPLCPAL